MSTVLWIVIYVALFYFMMRFGCCGGGHMSHRGHGRGSEDEHASHRGGGSTTDPVCGMSVGSGDGYSRSYDGREYRFCSKNCLDRFEKDPASYAIEERVAS